MDEKPVSLRLSSELIERADALIELFTNLPDTERATRSTVLRRALCEGLAVLENLLVRKKFRADNGVAGYAAIWKGNGPDSSGWIASDSMISLLKMLTRLDVPDPQLYQEVVVQPTVKEVKPLMEEEGPTT